MKSLKPVKYLLLTVGLAFALTGCSLFEKKPDPNFAAQLKTYETIAKAEQDTKKAEAEAKKSRPPISVLKITALPGEKIVLGGIAELSVNLPAEVFEKGGVTASSIESSPAAKVPTFVEPPSFVDKLIDRTFQALPYVDRIANTVIGQKEETKRQTSKDQMWADIFKSQKGDSFNYNGSFNTGGIQGNGSGNTSGNSGANSGDNRQNTSGNSGQNSGDNRDNPNNSGNNRNNPITNPPPACTPVAPATTC